ncbi:MAG: efflux RND transporter periplasmic adaptor subunit [Candidatus Dormibacteria bacterium]
MVVALLAAGGVFAGLKVIGAGGVQYRTTTVAVGSVTQTVSLTGTIEPVKQADLNFGTSGTVATVGVAVGQTVTAGAVVATLATAPLDAQVDQAQASLDGAASQLQADESSGGTASAYQLASDRANVDSAEIMLSMAEETLADAKLITPIGGTVISVDLVAGGMANAGPTTVGSPSASASSGSAAGEVSPVVEVVSPGAFEVQATASANQMARLKVGDKVSITPSGATTLVSGSVAEVSTNASISAGVANFPVTVAIAGDPSGLYEGASADLSIVVVEAQNVLTVPSSAVHYDGSKTFVYTLSKGRETMHQVTVGAVGGMLTEIKSGLRAGDVIVLASLSAGVPGGIATGPLGRGGGTVTIGPGSGGAIKQVIQQGG